MRGLYLSWKDIQVDHVKIDHTRTGSACGHQVTGHIAVRSIAFFGSKGLKIKLITLNFIKISPSISA